jgi:cell division protein FtsI/penicillin-binding protein 2
MLLAVLGLAVKLVDIQVIHHDQYLEEAMKTHLGATDVPAPRGTILDATGYPLATSIDTWDVYIDRFLWRDHAKAQQTATQLAALLKLDPAHLVQIGTDRDNGDALVERNIDYAIGEDIQQQGLWGVHLVPSSTRIYPEGDLAGQLVGYVGLDHNGLWGIESDFNSVLTGKPGWISTERDALGRPIAFGPRTERAPEDGGSVQLTIDRFIQAIIEKRLDEALKQYKAKSGEILVMDPMTGAILAMASRPTVNLSDVNLNDPNLESLVRNRVVTDLYEPGSVFKTITTAAALDLNLVTPESTYVDKGEVTVGGYTIRNWDYMAHGVTTVRAFLQQSLNTGAVWLAEKIGAKDFYRYVQRFGFGEATHVGLSGEADGLMRTPDDPDWYPADLATNSYGQGIAVTPLQMLTAVNVFANGGLLMRPYIVSRIVTADGVRTFEPVEVRRAIPERTAEIVAALMNDVVEGQPYHLARVPGYQVAGKTGTTLVSIPTGYELNTTIASFAGFLPYPNPRVSVLVKIDQPSGKVNLGGEVAAPVFAKVAGDIMQYLNQPPSPQVPPRQGIAQDPQTPQPPGRTAPLLPAPSPTAAPAAPQVAAR